MIEFTLSMGILCLVLIVLGISKAFDERDWGIALLLHLAFLVVVYADIRLIEELVHKWV